MPNPTSKKTTVTTTTTNKKPQTPTATTKEKQIKNIPPTTTTTTTTKTPPKLQINKTKKSTEVKEEEDDNTTKIIESLNNKKRKQPPTKIIEKDDDEEEVTTKGKLLNQVDDGDKVEEDEEDFIYEEDENEANNNNKKIEKKPIKSKVPEDATFESLGVHPQIIEACYKLGFTKPTEIQRETIPFALQGRDVIGLAQTGSGKTAAFAIPVLQRLLAAPQSLFALVLAPTRELAFQIAEQFEALGAIINVKCSVLVGGVEVMPQAISLAKKPHIVVGTPGRVLQHLESTKGFNLRSIKFFIMDEADRLFSAEFEEEINKILKVIPKERNTLLFSATMTSKVAKLQRASLNKPVKAQVATKYTTVDTLQQQYIFIPHKFKECYLVYILTEMAGNLTIIFTSTCASSNKLALLLRNLGLEAIPINGDMEQTKRLAALNKFKIGSKNILVATDVAARGLNIPEVDLVINFDVPSNSKEYIHRVGRTARAGKSGRSITFVTQYDIELYQRIEHVLQKKLDEYPTEQDNVLVLLERVNEANRIATNTLKETGMSEKRVAEDSEESTHIKKRKVEKKTTKKKKY
eukprot:gene2780-3455_t